MPTYDTPTVPAVCPQCHHSPARLRIRSDSFITVTCTACEHTWTIELAEATEAIRAAVQAIALSRGRTGIN